MIYACVCEDVTTEEEKGDRGILTMDANLAESIVRKWQNYKSLAMGPTHQLDPLKEVPVLSLFLMLIISY